MSTLGELLVKIGADNSEFKRKLSDIQSSTSKMGGVMRNALSFAGGQMLVNGLASVGRGIATVSKNAITMASDLQEVQNVVDTTFGESAKAVNEFAKSATDSFGLSELQAKKFSGAMGAMLKSTGISSDKLPEMSTKLVGLAGDFASFYNLPHDEAWEKIRSGIAGETEPLKQLGVNMSVASLEAFAMSQGINKAWKDMSPSEQAMLRYNYLLSVTKDAQGDFAKTQQSFANQIRLLKTNFEQTSASIATQFLPSINNMASALNKALTGKISWDEAGNEIQKGISDMVAKISEGLPKLTTIAGSALKGIITGLLNSLPAILPQLATVGVSVFTTLVNSLNGNMGMLMQSAGQALMILAQGFMQNLPTLANVAIQILLGLAQFFIQNLPTWMPYAVQMILQLCQMLIQNLPLLITAAIQIIMALVQGIAQALPVLLAEAPKIIQALIDGANETRPLFIQAMIDIILALVQIILDNLPLFINVAIQIIGALIVGIVQATPQIIAGIIKLVNQLDEKFRNYDWLSLGVNLIKGILRGIQSVDDQLKNYILNLAKQCLQKIKNALGIKSPSKEFFKVGVYTMIGMTRGIDKYSGSLVSSMQNVANGVLGVMKDTKDIMGNKDYTWDVRGNVLNDGFNAMVSVGGGSGVQSGIVVNISGNNINSNLDIDIIAQRLVSKLKSAGVY